MLGIGGRRGVITGTLGLELSGIGGRVRGRDDGEPGA
jgi:hypothetical protein